MYFLVFDWKAAYAPHKECCDTEIKCINDIKKAGFKTISAEVPGNFEIDLMNGGLLEPLYYSANALAAQKWENTDIWYYTVFETDDKDIYLRFGGIDTISDIYINGKLVKSTDNMFTAYDVSAEFNIGSNEIVVHIKPVCIEARKDVIPAECMALKHNYQSLYVRKAAHMYGWDIMPRIVSAGIWKDVEIIKKKPNKINEVFISASKIDFENNKALMRFYMNFDADEDCISDYTVKIVGKCGDSGFYAQEKLWHNSFMFNFTVDDCRLWWPKNYGEQNLYDTTVELFYKGKCCDKYHINVGIRTVELDRGDFIGENGSGEFCFKINGKRIFVLGTNWVPLDALHSRDAKRLGKALELLDGIGCNMVRCWGGNVYESDEFFDFCDRRGIMVWQDFAMACAIYPQEEKFIKMIENEAIYQVKRLRNHSSLVLWAGDNEVDMAYNGGWNVVPRNPNNNIITRTVIKKVLENHDLTRPYLPSSPFVSDAAYKNKLILPEDHLWGPRDYFKGDYYKNAKCRFASEIGYHGFPSPSSLKKFLKNPERIFNEEIVSDKEFVHDKELVPTDEYLVHAACVEADKNAPNAYRIKLAYDQVVTLFGRAEENFDDFVRQSQISQAEAKKYFIEKFRLSKWQKTGIIWWNLLDGWPQVSDAAVDYYFTKKLAYHYIKRSQNLVCFMFDEPNCNILDLYGVNDLSYDADAEYTVTNITENKEVLRGAIRLKANTSAKTGSISIKDGEQCFYLIKWTVNGKEYKNHYCTNIINIDYKKYTDEMAKCGFDEFEGFA